MRLMLLLCGAGVLLLGAVLFAATKGTPITVGDGSIHLRPGPVIHHLEWDSIGASVKKKRGGGNKIGSVNAVGKGVTGTPAAACDPSVNCTLTVLFREAGGSPEYVTLTVGSDAGTKGVHLSSSIPWTEFEWDEVHGVKNGEFKVVSAEFASGSKRTKLCTGADCQVTVDFQ